MEEKTTGKEAPKKQILLWLVTLGIGIVCVLLPLALWDSCMRGTLEEIILYEEGSIWWLILGTALAVFLITWLPLRLKGWQILCWIVLAVSGGALVYSEMLWSEGGWSQLGAGILWMGAFPAYLGVLLTVLANISPFVSRRVKLVCLAVVLTCGLLCLWFRPRPLTEKLTLDPDWSMCYYESDGTREMMKVKDAEAFRSALRWCKVSPCYSGEDWDDERGIIARLNDEFVVVAPHGEQPYVYEYSGALEGFSGETVRWKILNYSALYNELRQCGAWVE